MKVYTIKQTPLRFRLYQERLPGLSAVDAQKDGLGLVSPREYPAVASLLFPPLGTNKIAPPTLEAWWEILRTETPRPWGLEVLSWTVHLKLGGRGRRDLGSYA